MLIIIPLTLIILFSWYLRQNVLMKIDEYKKETKKIPRIIFIVCILLGLAPIVNIIVLVAMIIWFIVKLVDNGFEFKETKLNKFFGN